MAWQRSTTKIGYDQAGFVVDPRWHGTPWTAEDLEGELTERLTRQLAASQVVVDHYRVGYHWAFELPVRHRPSLLPADVAELKRYPWLIWLTWELVERWDTFATAWHVRGDVAVRRRWQQELAELDGWEHFRNWRDEVGLPTGHLAGALAAGLLVEDWEPGLRERAESAARRLLRQDVPGWFTETWVNDSSLKNIPIIVLCSTAALARVVNDPSADRYATRAQEAVTEWFAARHDDHHTELPAYNGYLFDAVTQWLEIEVAAGGPGAELVTTWRAEFTDLCHEWAQLTVPGRADLAVPLGDTEAEMTMWLTCVARISAWYGVDATAGAAWLWQRCAPDRLPAAAVGFGLRPGADGAAPEPVTGVQELPAAVAVRNGWGDDDPAIAVGLSRTDMGHLHGDNGHVIVAWRGRCWITDPGYQQYRPGQERTYSLGTQAHNSPVLAGIPQDRKAGRLVAQEPVTIDLTDCWSEPLDGVTVRRTVALSGDRVVVDDKVSGSEGRLPVEVHWLAGAGLAWAFVDGWLRLSDGSAAVWLGIGDADAVSALDPDAVLRHEGSRGPVGLRHTFTATQQRWQVVLDRSHGWQPPQWSV